MYGVRGSLCCGCPSGQSRPLRHIPSNQFCKPHNSTSVHSTWCEQNNGPPHTHHASTTHQTQQLLHVAVATVRSMSTKSAGIPRAFLHATTCTGPRNTRGETLARPHTTQLHSFPLLPRLTWRMAAELTWRNSQLGWLHTPLCVKNLHSSMRDGS